MRIRELVESSPDNQLVSTALTVISFLRNRAHNKKVLPDTSTGGFLTMLNNAMGGKGVVDYDTFERAATSDDTLKQLITNVDRNMITFKPFGDEPDAPQEMPADDAGAGKAKDPTKIVDKMAKRAADKRD